MFLQRLKTSEASVALQSEPPLTEDIALGSGSSQVSSPSHKRLLRVLQLKHCSSSYAPSLLTLMTLLDICPADWRSALSDVLTSVIAQGIEDQLARELANGDVYYPRFDRLFAALEGLSPRDVRVVILGQDPYHGERQATGRAFEVLESTPAPPSLVNIGKMLERDLGVAVGSRFQIGRWSEQGVMLLNTTLSVRAGVPESHKGLGWQTITDRIISVIATSDKPTAFLLWGAHAQKKSVLVNGPHNLVLMAPHPSPLSAYRGFFDCAHLSATNQWLTSQGDQAIRWESAC